MTSAVMMGLISALLAWIIVRALKLKRIQIAGTVWTRDINPAVYWFFICAHTLVIALVLIGAIIRLPS